MKVFEEYGYTNAEGLLLPYSEVHLFDNDKSKIEPEKLKKLMHDAEDFNSKELAALPASLYREFFKNGNRANFESKFFERRNQALFCALGEYIEGEGRFTEKLIDAVWAISEESTWMLPAHLYNSPTDSSSTLGPVYSDSALHGTALFSATTCADIACVLSLCSDILDKEEPVITRKLTHLVKTRGIKSFLEGTYWWGGKTGRKVNNWCPWIISNILFATAVVEEDMSVREAVVTKAMESLDCFFSCYKPDGGCDEGPAYWGAAGASLFDCLEIIEAMSGGKINIYDSLLVKNIGEYIVKVNISGTRFVNFADCAPRTSPTPSMLVRFGEKTGSRPLISFGKKLAAAGGEYMMHQSHIYRSLMSIFGTTPTSEDSPMPLSTWLENLEVMTARESDDDKIGMFLAAKGGRNDEMHNHNDVGNFMVYYNAEPVIIDTGVGTYTKQTFSPDRYKLWFMQSGYHNLPSFGGVDQHDGSDFYAQDTTYDADNCALSTDLTHAYPSEANLREYKRNTMMQDGIVTVTDSVTLNESSEIVFHFMTSVKPELIEPGRVALNMGRVLEYDTSLSINIEEFDPIGMNTVHAWGTPVLYRIHLSVNTDKCNVTFTIK